MKYTSGIDLHSNNLFLAVLDEHGNSVYDRKLSCDLNTVIVHGHDKLRINGHEDLRTWLKK